MSSKITLSLEEIKTLLAQGESIRGIARQLGDESLESSIRYHLKKNKLKNTQYEDLEEDSPEKKSLLARKGYSPEHGLNHPYPDGFKMGKVTIQRDKHGGIERTWERMMEDQERQREIMLAVVEEMSKSVYREKISLPPSATMKNLCNLYTITDAHVGMLAWGEESGEDWDLNIAAKTVIDWLKAAVATSPNAHTGVLCNLGDFLHFDGLEAVTPAHKHILDADTRFTKLVRVSIMIIRKMINMLLEKHEHVHVIMAEGNHDLASSVWLREMLYEMYKDEPRISIERNPDPYYAFSWGNTSLFFHHGHKSSLSKLDVTFVAKFKELFGRSKHVYGHCGHLHHVKMQETSLMIIEQHRTLAAKDAYASRGGWISGRDAKVITYSKEFGEVSRLTISPEMIK